MRYDAQVSSAPATIALNAKRWAEEWSKTRRQPAYVKNMRIRATQGDPAAKKWLDCYVAAQTAINIEKCFSDKSLARASAGASDSKSLPRH
ncbi:MAG: hypothetical protein GYA55_13185 [SAR324 cluster bacterium]|uniref:Uncharacterized protein n=1 Tax=SAR324 cluster bacterium TaxID=2024889 RepID=A0A7X9FU04_9DELT|nr:hypothetical protein [SAR324 cluster bacterium]